MAKKLRIGTRGSKLALVQAEMVVRALAAAAPEIEAEITVIKTSGDWKPEQGETALPETGGGKAHFAKEIEEALLARTVDCGVHSLKDMAAVLPDGLVIHHVLPRADARDAFLANKYKALADLPAGATVGTASPRRMAYVLAQRPDLKVVPLRGNVPTRIEKLRAGQVDATLLALAGLRRLGLEDEISSLLEAGDMIPAAAQGIIGIELRADDKHWHAVFGRLHHRDTGLCAAAERAAVAALGGSCHTPIGAHAVVKDGELVLDVVLSSRDGRQTFRETMRAAVTSDEEARALGAQAGNKIKGRAPGELLT